MPGSILITGRRGALRVDDRGGITVLAAGVVAALLATTMLLAQLGVAVVARHRADAAADVAALAAAAGILSGTAAACARAAEVTIRSGARLDSCSVDGMTVRVVVSTEPPWAAPLLAGERATARARAGPVEWSPQ